MFNVYFVCSYIHSLIHLFIYKYMFIFLKQFFFLIRKEKKR